MAKPVDQPPLGDDLHPGADARGAGAEPHQAKIAVFKCFKYPADQVSVSICPCKSLTCRTDTFAVSDNPGWLAFLLAEISRRDRERHL
jgi:hypothetical protein